MLHPAAAARSAPRRGRSSSASDSAVDLEGERLVNALVSCRTGRYTGSGWKA